MNESNYTDTHDELRSSLYDFIQDHHKVCRENGWWEDVYPGTVPSVERILSAIALTHGELGEATEEVRVKKFCNYFNAGSNKPEGMTAEFADVLLRIFDLVEAMGLTGDFVQTLTEKFEYNKTRGFRHGGKSA